jgi:hypothetical protein
LIQYFQHTQKNITDWTLELPPVSGSSATSCGAYLHGSSLGDQGDVNEVALLWLIEMFISCSESLLAKKKSASFQALAVLL